MNATAPVPYAVAARGLLRATLLDAMREQLRRRPWSAVTMADVARSAGVSRQTLYSELGSRAELAQAFVLHETDRFLAAVQEAVTARPDDAVAALGAAFDVFLAAAADDPLVRSVLGGAGTGADELLPLVTTQGEPVLERATQQLAAVVRDGWPQVGEADAVLLAETVVRLAISTAVLPAGPSAMSGRSVAALIGPYVERVLAGADR